MKGWLVGSALVCTVAISATPEKARAQDDLVTLDTWNVPWEGTRPRDPYLAPDGRVWFVGQQGHYAAVLDPESGDIRRYDLPDGTGPHNLIVDTDGMVWYAGNRVGTIGHLDPETGEIEIHEMPEDVRDPHTLLFGLDDDIWFTAQNSNRLGHFVKATGETRIWEAPQVEGRAGRMTGIRPYGIKLDSEGNPWVVFLGTNMLGTIRRESMELETFDLPEGARPRRLVIDSNDVIWYVDYARGKLASFDPDTHEVVEYDNPGGDGAQPYGVAIDADDRVWFVETGSVPNQFVGFDTRSKEYISVTPTSNDSGGAIRHMYYDARNNVIWYGADWDLVGRANLPPLSRRIISQDR